MMATDRTWLLTDLIAPWVGAEADALAVTFGERRWTWAEWARDIDRVAAALVGAGIGRGGRVGVLDKNHPACLQVVFAAAHLGAAVGVLNWRQAPEELVYVINDCAAEVLFVGAEFAETVAALRAQIPTVRRVVVIDGDGADSFDAFVECGEHPPAQTAEPDDLLLLIYSSGTTGRPKGVMLSHRALVVHTRNAGAGFPFEPGDRNLVAMPLFHVGGVCYALFGMAAGVESLMTREPDGASLVGALEAGATHAFFVPPVIAALLAAGDEAHAAVARLRYLGYGAAPTPLPLLQSALATWPTVNFVQVYGQTEVSGVAFTLRPEDHRDPDHPEWLLSVGTPVPGCEVRVVDLGSGEDAALGEQGEIWFRTEQAMLGYLNRPDATAETVTSDGWVRSGDIGRLDASGHLYVEDRLKDMIISGGENIYGPEVERVLLEHPDVVDAAAIGIPHARWGEAVHAVVVARTPMSSAALIGFCRERLAGYKCPSSVEFVELLPRNASGKLLKRELRDPHWTDRDRAI